MGLSLLASKGKVGAIKALITSASLNGRQGVVDAGGHLSAVNVVCNRKDEMDAVEESFRLLGLAWAKDVEEDCWPAVCRAVEIIVDGDGKGCDEVIGGCLELLTIAGRDKEGKKKILEGSRGGELVGRLSGMLDRGDAVQVLTMLVPFVEKDVGKSVVGKVIELIEKDGCDSASYSAVIGALHFLNVGEGNEGKIVDGLVKRLSGEDHGVKEDASLLLLTGNYDLSDNEKKVELVKAALEGGSVGNLGLALLVKLTVGGGEEFNELFQGEGVDRMLLERPPGCKAADLLLSRFGL